MQLLPLIPYPSRCELLAGQLTLDASTHIQADPDLQQSAEQIARRLRAATGYAIPVSESSSAPGMRIRFISDKRIDNHEAYDLKIDDAGVVISASAAPGAFYGGQTVLQLLPPAIFDEVKRLHIDWVVPFVKIQDSPRFRWRGVMLDSARHFQPISFIRKFIDLLSQHKLNVFHWHLVDDQGWRIEIKKYPRLTSVGAQRSESQSGHTLDSEPTMDGIPHGGFYTQEEIVCLVEYAAERHVQILPEIEMPGHAGAAVAAYPELGVVAEPVEVSTRWGVHEILFNTKISTFDFLQDVLGEVIDLFPFEYLHIGGDEAVKRQWKEDPATQAHIKELQLADEDELQRWFIEKMESFLRGRDRKLVGWDEILEGGLSENATVMSWRGREGAMQASKNGMKTILCDRDYLYFDYYQSDAVATEPMAIGGELTLEKVYSHDPLPDADDSEGLSGNLLGLQAQVWTEYIQTTSRLEYMTFPRLCAYAEVAWTSGERLGFESFLDRLRTHLRRLDTQDVRYRAPL